MRGPDDFGLASIDSTDPTIYPHARFKDDSGAGDGSLILAAIANNLYYAMIALMDAAGIVPDGNTETSLGADTPVTQVLDAVNAIADARSGLQAADYAMRDSGETAYTGAMPTSWTPLDLSPIVGANKTFVHLKIVGDASSKITFRPYGDTETISVITTSGPQGTSGAAIGGSGEAAFVTVTTDDDGIVDWLATTAGGGATEVIVAAYQGLVEPSGGSALYSVVVDDFASLPESPVDMTRRYIRAFHYTATYDAGTATWYNPMGGEVTEFG